MDECGESFTCIYCLTYGNISVTPYSRRPGHRHHCNRTGFVRLEFRTCALSYHSVLKQALIPLHQERILPWRMGLSSLYGWEWYMGREFHMHLLSPYIWKHLRYRLIGSTFELSLRFPTVHPCYPGEKVENLHLLCYKMLATWNQIYDPIGSQPTGIIWL